MMDLTPSSGRFDWDEDVAPVNLDGIIEQIRIWIYRGEYSHGQPFLAAEQIADYYGITLRDAESVYMGLMEHDLIKISPNGSVVVNLPKSPRSKRKAFKRETRPCAEALPNHAGKSPKVAPIYQRIYTTLKDRISRGEYKLIEFPTMAEAAAEFGVSRISIKAAYKKLQLDSLIVVSRGRRPEVNARTKQHRVISSIENLLDNLEQSQLSTDVRILKIERCAAGEDLALGLDCHPDDQIEQTVRLTELDSNPFSFVIISARPSVKALFQNETFERAMSKALLIEYGISPSKVTEEVSACNVDAEVAEVLNIEHGAAALKVKRIFYSESHGPILCTIGYYRSDMFKYFAIHLPDQSIGVDL